MGMRAGSRLNGRMEGPLLEFRLLGELQIVSDGREVALPASKKTRALLAYLVATGIRHRREWLCDLLWEGPDDPRGELRWSLAKIRPLLDAGGTIRLKTDRSGVAFEPRAATIDLVTARALLADLSNAPIQALKAAIALFRSEFLDGLDLPACYRFQEWCLAERAAASALRLGALRSLVDRLADDPEEALVHARALVAADPLSEQGHASVVRLLGRLGRRREAMAQYEQARTVLEREAGAPLSGALESARHAIGPRLAKPRGPPPAATGERKAAPAEWREAAIPFVGRLAERGHVDRLVSAAANGRATPVLLVTGEPGIGKSRLLDHLAERMAMIGGRCLRGRAFEAEAAHPYGAWIDALRGVAADIVPENLRQTLALLRPEYGSPPPAPIDRVRLFEAVLSLLRHLSHAAPLAVVLDDLQWLDEPSAALLHYLTRMLGAPEEALFACAARSGELGDNPAVSRALRGLDREERLLELPLAALSEAETAELVRTLDPDVGAASVFAEGDGNPLFVLELTRRHREGRHQPGRPLHAVIAGQFETLDEHCRSLVAWASAMGRTFDPALLARLTDCNTATLLAALDRLERRGIVRPVGEDCYDFVHDLVRQAAYQAISQPRRKLMHRQIARVLDAMVATDDRIAGDLLRHAELAGGHALAARACVTAGERSLRLFANTEALALARRGRSHINRLPDGTLRREVAIGLFKVEILAAAGPGLHPVPQVVEALTEAVAKAEEAGLHGAAAAGYYLLSVVHQQTSDTERARDSTVRAAEAGRSADWSTQARQLANTARCLVELETEIPKARVLLDEAETLLGALAGTECELQWGRGLTERWAGHNEEAAVRIERALDLARRAQDRWREYKCLAWLAVIAFERGRYEEAKSRCRELRAVAEQMGEEEAPVADIVEALGNAAEGREHGLRRLDAALARLRIVDDKSYLAYALNAAALLCLQGDQQDIAEAYANEAREVGVVAQRHNDVAIAEAVLALIQAREPEDALNERIGRLREQVADRDRFSARAWATVEQAAAIGLALPAVASEHPRRDKKRRSGRE